MGERPILFNTAMVRAVLSGRKTVTRRIAHAPPNGCHYRINGNQDKAVCIAGDPSDKLTSATLFVRPTARSKDHLLPCPYGGPGSKLWVREAWNATFVRDAKGAADWHDTPRAQRTQNRCRATRYRADAASYQDGRWATPLFMPRWASRLTLEVTGVRVERLHDITEADARAEGIKRVAFDDGPDGWEGQLTGDGVTRVPMDSARTAFADLWLEINGAGAWDANPWVWVVGFKRVETARERKVGR